MSLMQIANYYQESIKENLEAHHIFILFIKIVQ